MVALKNDTLANHVQAPWVASYITTTRLEPRRKLLSGTQPPRHSPVATDPEEMISSSSGSESEESWPGSESTSGYLSSKHTEDRDFIVSDSDIVSCDGSDPTAAREASIPVGAVRYGAVRCGTRMVPQI